MNPIIKSISASKSLLSLFVLPILLCGCGPRNASDLKDVTLVPAGEIQVIQKNDGTACGLADKDGKIILQPEYTRIEPIPSPEKPDRFVVKNKKEKWGVYDINGKEIISEDYDLISSCNNKTFHVYKHYEVTGSFSFGEHKSRKTAETASKMGIFDYDGKTIMPCKFGSISSQGDGYYIVRAAKEHAGLPGKKGLYKNGKKIIAPKWDELYLSGSNNGAVAIKYDRKHKKVKQDEYYLFDLANGARKTKFTNGRAGTTDNFVIATTHGNGRFSTSIYDFQGNTVIPSGKYQNISERNGLFICETASSGSNSILYDLKNNLFEQDDISLTFTSDGLITAYNRRNFKYGLIDSSGNWYVPCKYYKIKFAEDKIEAENWDHTIDVYPLPNK